MYVEYSANNSGGGWWLTDENWLDLERAGWEVQWIANDPYYKGDERHLGALATRAIKRDTTLGDAIHEWEHVTGQNSNSLGCSCCGTPHSFTLYDNKDNYVDSYYPSYPSYGDPYDW